MPLTKLTETELAYIAGIVDGEGSISLVRSTHAKRTRGRYIYPMVRVANTDRLLIEWLIAKTGCGAVRYSVQSGDRFKLVHHVGWAVSDAIELLKAIRPFLVIKAGRADLVLELDRVNRETLAAEGGYFGNGHPIPPELVQRRQRAFDELKALNAKGVPHSVN